MTVATRQSFRIERGRVTHFVEQHALAWELAMAGLTLVYVALALLVDQGLETLTSDVLIALALIFFAEFSIRFWDAASRLSYFKSHWIDLLTCLPPIGPLRVLRLLRLLGLLRLATQVRDVARAKAAKRGKGADGAGTWIVWPTALLVWIGAAEGFWMVERGQNPAIHSFGDALYLAFITVTTVGYGDIRPVTPEGKIIAGGLVFVGLGLLGFISAQMTARWLRTERGESEVERTLAHLSNEISELKELVRLGVGTSEAAPLRIQRADHKSDVEANVDEKKRLA